jgi:hypothetical protein
MLDAIMQCCGSATLVSIRISILVVYYADLFLSPSSEHLTKINADLCGGSELITLKETLNQIYKHYHPT